MPPPGFRHGEVAAQITFLLKAFVKVHPTGRVIGETGVRTEHDPDSVRGPDVSYWSFKRLPKARKVTTYPKVAADLCVEVRSPTNTLPKLRDKVAEYLRAGVRMVWVVYRRAGRGTKLWASEVLDGEDVVPGFSCSVSEFFEV